jgi:hypothetical protein
MRMAGILLAVATCCGATEAGAQLRAFVNVGPGGGNAPAPGSAGLGTAGLGLGGFGSATGRGASIASKVSPAKNP